MVIYLRELENWETIDKIVTIDISMRGAIGGIYEATRKVHDKPLTYSAAKALVKNVKPGDRVIIVTGFPVRAWISTAIGETDGPPGAAVVAKAVSVGLDAMPIIISDEGLRGLISVACNGVGLPTVEVRDVQKAVETIGKVHTLRCAAIDRFPADVEEAKRVACKVLDELRPSALISIERPGMNEKGFYHLSYGKELSGGSGRVLAKLDYLFEEARLRGVTTIGVGDLGNELGMGVIKDYVKANVPFGSQCKCPCKAGIASVTEVNHLVVSTVSNWGAYAIAACLAVLLEKPEILHRGETEKHVLNACTLNAGAYNGKVHSEKPELLGGADGLSDVTHASLVEVLRTTAMKLIERRRGKPHHTYVNSRDLSK